MTKMKIIVFLLVLAVHLVCSVSANGQGKGKPVIVITDLYHPHQDAGDNFDLINAYALPGIDLKAVLLDCHAPFRKEVAEGVGKGLFRDTDGPREPGFIPVQQLNYIFDQNVPTGVGPFHPMASVDDKMESIPAFQQSALTLLAKVLEQSKKQVTIVSFGSLRILAIANNRFPELMKRKVKEIHISAGTSNNHPDFLEWNVALDTNAFVSILRSDLPIILYPCAAGNIGEKDQGKFNAFVGDDRNTYYHLERMSFINKMDDRIKNYLDFLFSRSMRNDYLSLMDEPYEGDGKIFNRGHHVWETAIWMQVAGLRLVKRAGNKYAILPIEAIAETDSVFYEVLTPCKFVVRESGLFTYTPQAQSKKFVYARGNPDTYQAWMNHAVPLFYQALCKQSLK